MSESPSKSDVWHAWIREYVTLEEPVPLFETDADGVVQTTAYGADDRPILKRSAQMEALLSREGGKVVDDWHGTDDTYEGVIYLMYTLNEDGLVPRYVGKAGKYGTDGARLSANLRNIRTNRSKFGRWGNGYAYHLGELSAAVLEHHLADEVDHDEAPSAKYQAWADSLFVDGTQQLREPVYFWARAWRHDDTGLFHDFETSLESLEYQLISVGADLFPDALLNSEGA